MSYSSRCFDKSCTTTLSHAFSYVASYSPRTCLAKRVLRMIAPWSYMHSPNAIKSTEFWKRLNSKGQETQEKLLARVRHELFKDENNNHRCCVQTTDGKAKLDGILFKGTSKKVILFVPGLGGHYEEVAAVDSIFQKFVKGFQKLIPGVNVMTVNPRGVFVSTGEAAAGTWANDIYSTYKYLITKHGFKPEDVLVWGHSLGAPQALMAAAQIQEEYADKTISAVVDRSFLDFAEMIRERAGNGLWNVTMGTLGKYVIKALGLNMNGQKAAEQLKGTVLAIYAKGDQSIPTICSFALKANKKKIVDFKTIELALTQNADHTKALTDKDLDQVRKALQLETPSSNGKDSKEG